jgi:hypothetical protein
MKMSEETEAVFFAISPQKSAIIFAESIDTPLMPLLSHEALNL